MFLARRLPRHLLSLLVMLIAVSRADAQGIPVPAETPRAGAQSKSATPERSIKSGWRTKGSVVPAQAELPALPETTAEPTLAPPIEEPASEMQTLRAPANSVESDEEPESDAESYQRLPPRANPLRQARRPQAYPPRSPYQRVQNPVDVEVDPEPVPRPDPPRVILNLPNQPNARRMPQEYDYRRGFVPEPEFVQPEEVGHDGYDQSPDGQIPGEELYGLPRVFETNAYGRFTGRGEPLTAGSWLNRPYYVGGFIGGIGGDTLIPGEINQNGGFFWGGNMGWDYDPYWGLEMRLAFASEGLDYLQFPTIDNSYNELLLWDTSFVYYPWGDSRWRPYFKLGFGFADFDFTDATGIRRSEMVYEMPFGIGLKYRVNQYWVWRFDATDNLIFGGNVGLETQNQFSLTAGLEYRFGGRRQSYWPWNPSRRWR